MAHWLEFRVVEVKSYIGKMKMQASEVSSNVLVNTFKMLSKTPNKSNGIYTMHMILCGTH